LAATVNTATIGGLLHADSIFVGVNATDKQDLLLSLIESFRGREGVEDLQLLTDAILERESMLSTGVGDGIALPHAKTPAVSETLAVLATTSEPIPFDSFDNAPVRLVFMLIGPPSASREHVRILGRISRLLQRVHVRDAVLASTSPSDIIEILEQAEESIMLE
jgi:PTS system fructose-specific IIA component